VVHIEGKPLPRQLKVGGAFILICPPIDSHEFIVN
jgi:hypothetical protein